jgi:hypothetical protein
MHTLEGLLRWVTLSLCVCAAGCGSRMVMTAPPAPADRAAITPPAVARPVARATPTPLVAAADPVASKVAAEEPPRASVPAKSAPAKNKRGKGAATAHREDPQLDAASVADAEAMIRLARTEVDSALR